MARRGHGEGSIYLRSDGRWAASISVEGGKRKTFYGKTRKEVQEQLKTVLHQQQQGILASGPQQTVKQFLTQWLEDHKHSIRVRSYERYEEMVRLHFIPILGRYQLQKLTAQQVRAFYTKKAERRSLPHYGEWTARRAAQGTRRRCAPGHPRAQRLRRGFTPAQSAL